MTRTPRRPVSFRAVSLGVLALVGVAGACPGPACAGDPPSPTPPPPPTSSPIAPMAPKPVELPADVVARVRGRDLSRADFEARLVTRMLPDLADPASSATGVFQILIEEMIVRQEADRLGIRVSTEDYDRRYAQIDKQVRDQSGGERSLADVVREKRMTGPEFRARLEDVIRKERIAGHPTYLGDALPKDEGARVAQVEVVIKQILKKAVVEREGLPAGVVAKVNGVPMTVAAYGAALHARLAESEIRRIVQETCLTMLLDEEGLAFTAADVDQEIELDRPMFERMRLEAISPEKKALGFEGFLQLRYGASPQELHESAYRRGLFALRRRLRAAVTDDDVLKAWTAGSQDEYGPSVVVTDLLVGFQNEKAVVANTERRSEEEARRVIADFARRLAAGETMKAIEAEIKAKGDRTVVVDRRAVINKGNDLRFYEAAMGLADGAWSPPMTVFSAMHLVRRDAYRPPPKFEDVKSVVRQHLVDQKAQSWLQDRMSYDVVIAR